VGGIVGVFASNLLSAALTARARPVAVFVCSGEALRRHGGKRRRLDVDRYPSGQIRYDGNADLGHPRTLWRRAVIVGQALAWDPRADHPVGQALLLRHLEDAPQPGVKREDRERHAQRRYDAIDNFTKLHRAVFGIGSAQSNLKHAATGMARYASAQGAADNAGAALRLGRMIKRVRAVEDAPYAYEVLQLVALDEGPVNMDGQPDIRLLTASQLIWLRLAADALMNDRAQGAERTEVAKLPRVRGLEVRFDRESEGPDNDAVLAAIERLKSTIGTG
jgi:hypothetical protein